MEKKKKLTKMDAITNHLIRYGSITDPVARNSYHTNRLSGYINVLRRKRGFTIQSVWQTGRDKFGKHRYTKYILIDVPIERR